MYCFKSISLQKLTIVIVLNLFGREKASYYSLQCALKVPHLLTFMSISDIDLYYFMMSLQLYHQGTGCVLSNTFGVNDAGFIHQD